MLGNTQALDSRCIWTRWPLPHVSHPSGWWHGNGSGIPTKPGNWRILGSLTTHCGMLWTPSQFDQSAFTRHTTTESRSLSGSQYSMNPLSKQGLLWELLKHEAMPTADLCCLLWMLFLEFFTIVDVSRAIWGANQFSVWPYSPYFLSNNWSYICVLTSTYRDRMNF